MKTKINTNELCKMVRYARSRGRLFWTREERQHFISNGHWLVRFDEVPRDVLVSLFGVFCKIPEVGQTLVTQSGQEVESKPIDFSKIYQPDKQSVFGEVTPFLKDIGQNQLCRIIKFPEHHVIVDENYFKMAIDYSNPKTQGKGSHYPIYLAGDDLMILPLRYHDEKQDEIMKEIVGGAV